ncbi:hypothetical protein CHLRE_02g095056v5 [Chlamydomonas reinhardtii]|uniref:Uncharacterized protein n=1 Tax=Chlamydomonas reinhardtii TaxID=3055 RepID=A0A2K3E1L7_CHLRE|nr:uncharacterized protein CHLRE_02g095056v5 [Chlamydomonas reinhardtii]PNW86669.1 hypothetical protein CHLRE_02g095056v5 [Chlamydomonas reinhardtii]
MHNSMYRSAQRSTCVASTNACMERPIEALVRGPEQRGLGVAAAAILGGGVRQLVVHHVPQQPPQPAGCSSAKINSAAPL